MVIIPPQSSTVQFDKLEPDQDYLVHVQTITSSGVGNTLTTSFRIDWNDTSKKLPSASLSDYWRKKTATYVNSIITDHRNNKQISEDIDQQSKMNENNEILYNHEGFPGATVLELPLESGASSLIRWTYVVFMSILLRYFCIVDML